MKIVWTPRAIEDTESIVDYIGSGSPEAAARVATMIVDQITGLASMPHIGRMG